jgi:DNA-binding beta-propeller fold protein YncE
VDARGIITTVAGSGGAGYSGDGGLATAAELNQPRQVALDRSGTLFIGDMVNHRVRAVSPNGIIRTVAGNGTPSFSGDGGSAREAALNRPYGVAVDSQGRLYVADDGNKRVRLVQDGAISTVLGPDGLDTPASLRFDHVGRLLVMDNDGNRLLRLSRP